MSSGSYINIVLSEDTGKWEEDFGQYSKRNQSLWKRMRLPIGKAPFNEGNIGKVIDGVYEELSPLRFNNGDFETFMTYAIHIMQKCRVKTVEEAVSFMRYSPEENSVFNVILKNTKESSMRTVYLDGSGVSIKSFLEDLPSVYEEVIGEPIKGVSPFMAFHVLTRPEVSKSRFPWIERMANLYMVPGTKRTIMDLSTKNKAKFLTSFNEYNGIASHSDDKGLINPFIAGILKIEESSGSDYIKWFREFNLSRMENCLPIFSFDKMAARLEVLDAFEKGSNVREKIEEVFAPYQFENIFETFPFLSLMGDYVLSLGESEDDKVNKYVAANILLKGCVKYENGKVIPRHFDFLKYRILSDILNTTEEFGHFISSIRFLMDITTLKNTQRLRQIGLLEKAIQVYISKNEEIKGIPPEWVFPSLGLNRGAIKW